MSDHYGDPIPPRHGEEETWQSYPVCPICGAMARAELLQRKGPEDPIRGPYRCDLHGEVTPEWVWPNEEEEE